MKLIRRLNASFQRLRRNRHILAKENALTDQEYRLWDLLIALYDWDKNHTETFGTVEATVRELAELLSWKNGSKASRNLKGLIKKEIVTRIGRSKYRVLTPQTESTVIAPPQREIANLQHGTAPMTQNIASEQQSRGYSSYSHIVSFKGEHKDSNSAGLSSEEIEEIEEVMNEAEDVGGQNFNKRKVFENFKRG